VEVGTQTTLWAERFDREVRDILDVQDEIASVIVNTLVGRLVYRHYTRVRLLDADAVTAYEHTLKAQHHIWTFSSEDLLLAKREAELAISLDPNYARAHAVLAWALQIQGANGWSDDPDKPYDKAVEHAKAAVAADENEPWGHCTLGFTLWFRDRDFKRGLDEARQAVRLNPSNAHFRMVVGGLLAYMGNGDEALEEIDTAMRLNPLYPGLYLVHQSRAFFVAGKYEDALSQIERAAVAMPAHANALAMLAACNAVLGRMDSAAKVISELRLASPDFTLKYVRRAVPYASSADLDLFCNLLQEAGLPE
jgi:adenylate cyclase